MAGAIKISKPGANVLTAKDNELIFNSDYPLLKIHKQGSGRMIIDDGVLSKVVIYHDVGKIPMYFVRGQIVNPGFGDTKTEHYVRYPQMYYFGIGQWGYSKVVAFADRIEIWWQYPFITPKFLYYDFWIYEDPIFL